MVVVACHARSSFLSFLFFLLHFYIYSSFLFPIPSLFIVYFSFNYTKRTALIHPSNSGLFVTCANFPHTTFPLVVTKPKSLTFTSITVPFVNTPNCVDSFSLLKYLSKMLLGVLGDTHVLF